MLLFLVFALIDSYAACLLSFIHSFVLSFHFNPGHEMKSEVVLARHNNADGIKDFVRFLFI